MKASSSDERIRCTVCFTIGKRLYKMVCDWLYCSVRLLIKSRVKSQLMSRRCNINQAYTMHTPVFFIRMKHFRRTRYDIRKRFLHLSLKIKPTSLQEPSELRKHLLKKKKIQCYKCLRTKSLILSNFLLDEQSLAPRDYKVGWMGDKHPSSTQNIFSYQ